MLDTLISLNIVQAGWIGCSTLTTVGAGLVAAAVLMIWYDHFKHSKKKFVLGFNKGTGLLLIVAAMALIIVSSWV